MAPLFGESRVSVALAGLLFANGAQPSSVLQRASLFFFFEGSDADVG